MFTKKYDWLVVGSGFFGATFAREAKHAGKSVLVIEKSGYVGGHAYTKEINGIQVHMCGPHYFHTNNLETWNYVNKFAQFNHYQPKVNAEYRNRIFSLPFNMITFNQLWGCRTPGEAKAKIQSQIVKCENPTTLEEMALATVGRDIYEILIKGYTTKQWGREPKWLPASIIKRIPIRFTFNNNYHNAEYCGVPVEGYTNLVTNMLKGIDLELNSDFFNLRDWRKLAKRLLYTGPLDHFFESKYGALEYRSLTFKNNLVDGDFQGVGQVNYTDVEVPYTRIIEHKHFCLDSVQNTKSIITFEYPESWDIGKEPYYPINDARNNELRDKYKEEAKNLKDVFIAGRLGSYAYLDMDQTIEKAANLAREIA